MKTKGELLERLGRAISSDASATGRLKDAPDEAAFIRVLGEIAREKGFDLGEGDFRGLVFQRTAVSEEVDDAHLESVAGGGGGDTKGGTADGAAADRRRAGLDNIQKLLDILHSMNPQLGR